MFLLVLYFFLTIFISFLCSLLEATLLSVTKSFIDSLENSKKSQALRYVVLKKEESISSILTVNTFANTLGSAAVGFSASAVFNDTMVEIVAVLLTISVLFIAEIIPKTIGVTYWRTIAPSTAYVIFFLNKIAYPLVFISKSITRLISLNATTEKISREEIIAFAGIGERAGAIKSAENDIIENLLKVGSKKVRDIATPRSVVFAFDENTNVGLAKDSDDIYVYSRIPVFNNSLDNVTGLVFSQDILEKNLDGLVDVSLKEIKVSIYTVSENLPLLKLYNLFIKRREHMFLVHDEYSQTSGIVTLEDVLEELLGVEILDETDEVADMRQLAKDMAKKIRKEKSKNEQFSD